MDFYGFDPDFLDQEEAAPGAKGPWAARGVPEAGAPLEGLEFYRLLILFW